MTQCESIVFRIAIAGALVGVLAAASIAAHDEKSEPPKLPADEEPAWRKVSDEVLPPEDRAVFAKLERRITVKFEKTPMAEAVETIEKQAGVKIAADWESLGAAGLSSKTPVTYAGENECAGWVLDRLFDPRGADARPVVIDVLIGEITAGTEDIGGPWMKKPEDLGAAYWVLRRAGAFRGGAVGAGGMKPAEYRAFELILQSPDAPAIFKDLHAHARDAGRLYALSGLSLVEPTTFEKLWPTFAKRDPVVVNMFGCIVSSGRVSEWINAKQLKEFAQWAARER